MKYIIVLGDGMSGWKIPQLGNKTCLEAASSPFLDKLAPLSETGLCKTVPNGLKPGSDVANMAVLGFDPNKYYTGRSPLEAVAMGIKLKDDDVTLRCNLVTLSDNEPYEEKVMIDYAAGDIPTDEACELIDSIKQFIENQNFKLYKGTSYRHCIVAAGGVTGHEFTPPHDITDKVIKEYLPKGANAAVYREFMQKSSNLLQNHPINIKRVKEGKKPANGVWIWGEGTKPALENFEKLHALKGGVITAVDLVKGLGLLAGLQILENPRFTANYKTDFKLKTQTALNALLGGLDFIYIHVDAPDECAHHGDFANKIYSIEQIDKMVGEITETLKNAGENFAVLVCPDHPTPCALKTHVSEPVPYLLYSDKRSIDGTALRYTECEAAKSGIVIENGHTLINRLLNIK